MIALLRLLRVGTLFSPAADVVAGLCLQGLPWTPEAARAAGASVLLYGAGMVLNDHADRHVDAKLRPERPLPSGQISPYAALSLGVGMTAAAVALSPWPLYYAVMAGLVLGYDYVVKAHDLIGALVMGSLRGMNLAAGAVVVTHAAPDRAVLIAAGCYAAYIVAVTLLGILEDSPHVKPRVVTSVQHVPPLVAAVAMLGMPRPWPAAAVAFGLAALFLWRLRRITRWDQAAIRGSMTWLLLGTMLYTSLLCMSAHRWIECAVIAAAVFPARWISRRIALT